MVRVEVGVHSNRQLQKIEREVDHMKAELDIEKDIKKLHL